MSELARRNRKPARDPGKRRTRSHTIGLSLLSLLCLGEVTLAWGAYREPLASPKGAVSSDHMLASQAGAEVLRKGGNAVDAAVATALALGVVQPSGSGLGGGGFLVVRKKDGTVKVLDFRETAPEKASQDMFIDKKTGKVDPELSRHSGLAVATPAEPAGLSAALKELGTMTAAQVAAPALRLARDGFPAPGHLVEEAEYTLKKLPADSPLLALLAPGGKILTRGQMVRRPELAKTLAAISREGFGAFYKEGRGGIAKQIVAAAQKQGGVLSMADLAAYRPLWRQPIEGSFRGWKIYTIPPPGGGLTTLEALQVLDARPPLADGPGASSTLHIIAESLKHAFADRARILGDPAFVDLPIAELSSAAYAKQLAARLHDDKVLPAASYGKAPGPGSAPRDHGTTHLCVIDGEGNAAALTTTVNLNFGAQIVAGNTGVILNNQMDDFSAQPGVQNAFGLVGDKANLVQPGKRPLSSMTPLIAVGPDGSVICAGGAGGPTIVTGTVQAVVNAIDFKMDVQAAVSAPRLHTQFIPATVRIEADVPKDVLEALRKRGHELKVVPRMWTAVQMAMRVPAHTGADCPVGGCPAVVSAAADPRKGGDAASP